jgi:hypothetical protein
MAGQTKFTPEKLGQITTLVESGKNRQEIAALLGVTVGSLQVTCSRLGISLRRIERRRANETVTSASASVQQSKIAETQQHSQLRPVNKPAPPHQVHARTDATAAKFALKMQYKGKERTTDLPFSQDMITQLAFEAQLRNMRICDFLGELFRTTIKKDLFQRVLEPGPEPRFQARADASSSAKEMVPRGAPNICSGTFE